MEYEALLSPISLQFEGNLQGYTPTLMLQLRGPLLLPWRWYFKLELNLYPITH